MVEVPNMHHIRFEYIEQSSKLSINLTMTILIQCLSQIDNMQFDTHIRRIRFLRENVVWQEFVLLPGEDMDLMAICKGLCQCLCINFGTSIIAHRIAVNDQEDFHGISTSIVVLILLVHPHPLLPCLVYQIVGTLRNFSLALPFMRLYI